MKYSTHCMSCMCTPCGFATSYVVIHEAEVSITSFEKMEKISQNKSEIILVEIVAVWTRKKGAEQSQS